MNDNVVELFPMLEECEGYEIIVALVCARILTMNDDGDFVLSEKGLSLDEGQVIKIWEQILNNDIPCLVPLQMSVPAKEAIWRLRRSGEITDAIADEMLSDLECEGYLEPRGKGYRTPKDHKYRD